MSDDIDELIEALSDSRSPKRRSAARKLRKLGDSRAGPGLMTALQRELEDTRTWETQYQMIMALGECGYLDSLSYLQELADRKFEATMVSVALGDSIIRLSSPLDDEGQPLMQILGSGNDSLIAGALRAVAMLHVVPSAAVIQAILRYARDASEETIIQTNRWLWPAAAAPGWLEVCDEVGEFLDDCMRLPSPDLQKTAQESLKGKYKKWRPL